MVADRMAARREGTDQILVIDLAAHYPTQSIGQNGQTPLDHRTGLRGAETRVGAGPLGRPQLARVSPPRHAMYYSLWVPGGRAEPFFPLGMAARVSLSFEPPGATRFGHSASITLHRICGRADFSAVRHPQCKPPMRSSYDP